MGIESLALSVGSRVMQSALNPNGMVNNMAKAAGNKFIRIMNGTSASANQSPQTVQPESTTMPQPKLNLHHIAGLAETGQYFDSLDSNSDGQLSQSELTTGMTTIDEKLAQLKSQHPEDTGAIASLEKAHLFAENALKSYQNVAGLDGNASGISQNDVIRLASQAGQADQLNHLDWQHV